MTAVNVSSVSRVCFTVPGAPVPKGRPKFARRGKFVTTYTPAATASYENLVKVTAQQAMAAPAAVSLVSARPAAAVAAAVQAALLALVARHGHVWLVDWQRPSSPAP